MCDRGLPRGVFMARGGRLLSGCFKGIPGQTTVTPRESRSLADQNLMPYVRCELLQGCKEA